MFAVELVDGFLAAPSVAFEFEEQLLCDLCLLLRGGAAEFVERNVEPFVDALVDLMVLVADLLRSRLLFQGLGLRSRSVFIRTACTKHKQTEKQKKSMSTLEYAKHQHKCRMGCLVCSSTDRCRWRCGRGGGRIVHTHPH